jgi:hypothetical protein
VDLKEAANNFKRAMEHCDNLVAVHRGYGGPSAGRRRKEVSVNRAVVVLAIANWQAVIQDFALACVDVSIPPPGGPLSPATYKVLTGRVRKEVGDFSTPSAQNARDLLIASGYDPRSYWTWTTHSGRGGATVTLKPSDVEDRINQWVKVRHAIAHGHAALPQVEVLQAVRLDAGTPPVDPPLRLVDADQCISFFRRVAQVTGSGLAAQLGVSVPRL